MKVLIEVRDINPKDPDDFDVIAKKEIPCIDVSTEEPLGHMPRKHTVIPSSFTAEQTLLKFLKSVDHMVFEIRTIRGLSTSIITLWSNEYFINTRVIVGKTIISLTQ